MTDELGPLYLGVPESMLPSLGRIVVASGYLEERVDRIAQALGRNTREKSAERSVREIKDTLRDEGMPSWSTIVEEDVRDWLSGVMPAMRERDRIFHRVSFVARSPDRTIALARARALKTGDEAEVSVEANEAVAARLTETARAGRRIERGLLVTVVPDKLWMRVYGADVYGRSTAIDHQSLSDPWAKSNMRRAWETQVLPVIGEPVPLALEDVLPLGIGVILGTTGKARLS